MGTNLLAFYVKIIGNQTLVSRMDMPNLSLLWVHIKRTQKVALKSEDGQKQTSSAVTCVPLANILDEIKMKSAMMMAAPTADATLDSKSASH